MPAPPPGATAPSGAVRPEIGHGERAAAIKTDGALEQDVRKELLYDARLDDPADIAASAEFGEITLRGTVATFFEKRAAETAVKRVAGVIDVDNRIDVRLMTEHQREDAEIRGAALQRLMSDAQIPADRLDVQVKDGWLTLTGESTGSSLCG
jgi:osmotically-inducible protein OsmY